ncbi:MAG: hypothetical protein U0531_18630 [Dehalococcoidia bacterium]
MQATPTRPPRPTRSWLALSVLLAVVLVARLPFLPRLGHGYDLEEYRSWTAAIQRHGLTEVFEHTDADYVGYHYLLWLTARGFDRDLGTLTLRDPWVRLWLKLPGLAGDLLSTLVVWAVAGALARSSAAGALPPLARRLAGRQRRRLGPAAVTAFVAGLLWGSPGADLGGHGARAGSTW